MCCAVGFARNKLNTSSRPPEHPGGIIGCKDKKKGPDGIDSNIGSTVQYHVGACFSVAQFIFSNDHHKAPQ